MMFLNLLRKILGRLKVFAATPVARIIYRKTGKRPTVEQMFEEFPMWMEGDQDDERLKFSVAF